VITRPPPCYFRNHGPVWISFDRVFTLTTEAVKVASYTILLSLGLYLGACFSAHAQSLEQSVAFFLGSGLVDPSQMKQVDDSTVSVPGAGTLGAIQTPSFTLTTIDRNNCVFQMSVLPQTAYSKDVTLYFNHVTNVSIENGATALNGNVRYDEYTVDLIGETSVQCTDAGCLTHSGVPVYAATLDRMKKALDYIYSGYCTLAPKREKF
jgi:hypothetical protein